MLAQVRSIASRLRPFIDEGVKIVLWFFLVAAVIIFSLHSLLSISFPYSLDYGEAPLIDQARRLATGENIYRTNLDSPPYTIANYPPLYPLTLAPFLDLFDSPFTVGRLVSTVAALISAACLGLLILGLTRDSFSALVTGVFFLASPYLVQWAGRARIDLLALAFASTALLLLARWPRKRWSWLAAGLLLVAAAFTRQSYALAAPLAAFFWLWVHDKKRAVGLAVLVGGLGLGLFVLLNFLTEGGFYYHIVTANVNEFGWERLQDNLDRLWQDQWIILLLALLFLGIGWRSQKAWPLVGAFLAGAFLSALTIGKIGSNVNYFLELSAALALASGMLMFWSRPFGWRGTAVLFLICLQIGMLLDSSMRHNTDFILAPRLADFSALQRLEQVVLDFADPVLADEDMGMLTRNDRALYLQPFEVTQLAAAGLWDQRPLLDEIAAQAFDGILIHYPVYGPVYRERWSPEMLAAIEDHYRPAQTLASSVIYLPRGEIAISPVPPPAARSAPDSDVVETATPVAVSRAGFLAEPAIAINPANPQDLVAIATRVSRPDCELPTCIVELVLHTTADGGESWQERLAVGGPRQVMYHGLVTFDLSGTLSVLGIRNDTIVINQAAAGEYEVLATTIFREITRAQVAARPWLRVNPQNGELFLTLDAQLENLVFVTPSLMRSPDGLRWSTISRADLRISAADIDRARAMGPEDIQVHFGSGQGVSLIWVWAAEAGTWPRTVWMANSQDGGVHFGEPVPIMETWGPIRTASRDEMLSIVYRTGTAEEQQLAVASTGDSGGSWVSVIASGNQHTIPGAHGAAEIDISQNGVIDLVYYVQTGETAECMPASESGLIIQMSGQVDTCQYDLMYTFSNDGGRSFAEPLRLNQEPIYGENFLPAVGFGQAGSPLGIASGDEFAYPVWIGTSQEGSNQLFSMKIER